MLPFPNFESSISQRRMLTKGKNLYENSTLTRVESQRNGVWNVYFPSGTDNDEYKVIFQIKDGWVFYYHCPCPSLQGPMCEHSIAGLFEIRALYEQEENGESHENDDEDERERPGTRRSTRNTNNNGQKAKSNIVDPTELLRDEKHHWELTQTEKEFECQVCLSSLKGPVLLPCQTHSICYACLEGLFAHKKKERDGKKSMNCPTCGDKSGLLRVLKVEKVQINLGLQNIMKSYHSLREAWEEEKNNLQIQIAETKALSQNLMKIENENENENGNGKNKEKKGNGNRIKRKDPAPPKSAEDFRMEEEEAQQLGGLKKLKLSSSSKI